MPQYEYEHIHLISADPEKTAKFYIDHLGAQQEGLMPLPGGTKAVRLKLNGTLIIVSPPRTQPATYGLDHFGIFTDNIDASVAELKAAGCRFRMEPTEFAPGTRIAFFFTPENVLIELIENRNRGK